MAGYEGRKIGNYYIRRQLGQGGFADVYLGEHIHLHNIVAIKILKVITDNVQLENLYFEALTTAQLVHPHIIRIIEFKPNVDPPFIVMDYAPNGTLRQRYPKGICMPLNVVLTYTEQIASALQHAHNLRIIHRDIKPENILLGANDEAIITDFGIATLKHHTSSLKTLDQAGTAPYMAPEQINRKALPASDQYALAIMVYEWLCGSRPFEGMPIAILYQHVHDLPPPLREKMSLLPLAIEEVVLKALNKDPKQRFSSVEAFARELQLAGHPTNNLSLRKLSMDLGKASSKVIQLHDDPPVGNGQKWKGKHDQETPIIFILGRPGSGKTTAARHIIEIVSRHDKNFIRISAYDILYNMFQRDVHMVQFFPEEHGSFQVRDLTVFDTALEELERNIWDLRYRGSHGLIIVELAHGDYRTALLRFSQNLLINASILFIDADMDICQKRIQDRIKDNNESNDNYYVPDSLMSQYYSKDQYIYMKTQLKKEIPVNALETIFNGGALSEFINKVSNFAQMLPTI